MRCVAVFLLLSILLFARAEHSHGREPEAHHHEHHHHDEHRHNHHAHHHNHGKPNPLLIKLTTSLTHLLKPLNTLPTESAALTASLLTSSVTLLSLPLLPLTPYLHHLLPFAAGALISDLTTHVLPAIQASTTPLLISVLCFTLLDALLRRTRPTQAAAAINLAADALHNFCDGLSLAAAFLLSPSAGISATVAVVLHELPQEVADYALLLRSGFSHFTALAANFLCACTALLGTFVALRLGKGVGSDSVMPFAAGGLMYLTFSSIIPDIVSDLAAPVAVDGKAVPVPIVTFLRRILVASVMAAAGVAVITLVETAHEH